MRQTLENIQKNVDREIYKKVCYNVQNLTAFF